MSSIETKNFNTECLKAFYPKRLFIFIFINDGDTDYFFHSLMFCSVHKRLNLLSTVTEIKLEVKKKKKHNNALLKQWEIYSLKYLQAQKK